MSPWSVYESSPPLAFPRGHESSSTKIYSEEECAGRAEGRARGARGQSGQERAGGGEGG